MSEVALSLQPAGAQVELITAAQSSPYGLEPADGVVEADGVAEPVAAWAVALLLGHQPSTRRAYGTGLRDYLTWCADTGLDPWTARRVDVDAYLERLRTAGAAPATMVRRLAAIGGLYSYAVAEGHLPRSPVTHVRRPPTGQHAVSTGLSRYELAALVAAAEADRPRSAVAVLLLGLNGLRVSEVCGAAAEDLDTERGHTVRGITRKGGRTARIPLAPRTAAAIALELELGDCTTGPLLRITTGQGMDRHAVWRLLRRLARTDVPDKATTLHPHDLRHAFVTLALDAGASLRDIQDAAGHADLRTTRLYDRARYNLDRHPTYALASLHEAPTANPMTPAPAVRRPATGEPAAGHFGSVAELAQLCQRADGQRAPGLQRLERALRVHRVHRLDRVEQVVRLTGPMRRQHQHVVVHGRGGQCGGLVFDVPDPVELTAQLADLDDVPGPCGALDDVHDLDGGHRDDHGGDLGRLVGRHTGLGVDQRIGRVDLGR